MSIWASGPCQQGYKHTTGGELWKEVKFRQNAKSRKFHLAEFYPFYVLNRNNIFLKISV